LILTFQFFLNNFIVFKEELCDIETLNFKVSQFDEKLVQKEQKCKDIFEELIRIKSENSNLKNQLNSVQDENSYLKSRNKALLDYTENVIIKNFENSGKRFDELSERQQYRKLNTLGTYVGQALAFAETFGRLDHQKI
jgi:predicted nuclease with TOPRIM domain